MAIYRNISTSFWTDPKVDDDFSSEDKYFYLYLLTNPHTNITGCYELGRRQAERETGYTWDNIENIIKRMEKVHNIVRYDAATKEILLLNWGKYNWSKSEKLEISVKKSANEIKNANFRDFVINAVETRDFNYIYINNNISDTDYSNSYSYSTATATEESIGYAYPMHRVSKTAQKQSVASGKNIPPSLDDVKNYCYENKKNIDAEAFYDFYSSKNWMIGKNKMSNWHMAVSTWERKNREENKLFDYRKNAIVSDPVQSVPSFAEY